jgi:L-alanine-DL-glutamate epimerase-like enolase superfamily enzyme
MSFARSDSAPIERIEAAAYTIPTDRPESDGTFVWNKTTLVVVHAQAGGARGIGYTYTGAAAARLVRDTLAEAVQGHDATAVPGAWAKMVRSVRNLGRSGLAQTAIAAVDAALWDLKAKLAGLPLATLLGAARARVPVYGSGGFTSYTEAELAEQLGGWIAGGIPRVKMKVGRDPSADPARVHVARQAIGPAARLFVDANGAYSRKQALALADRFAREGVSWFEEPVTADDLDGLRLLRDRAPAGMDVAAGEYGYDLFYFRRMLEADAVDVLQADASRCGITGFLAAGALCEARSLDLSGHCAPSLHLHPACAVQRLAHLEYFHDHARIEHMLFEGAPSPSEGAIAPDLARPGLGIELKRADAERYAA